jgi:hypothetical protein
VLLVVVIIGLLLWVIAMKEVRGVIVARVVGPPSGHIDQLGVRGCLLLRIGVIGVETLPLLYLRLLPGVLR